MLFLFGLQVNNKNRFRLDKGQSEVFFTFMLLGQMLNDSDEIAQDSAESQCND